MTALLAATTKGTEYLIALVGLAAFVMFLWFLRARRQRSR